MKTNICRVCLSFLLIMTLCLTSCAGSFFEGESGNMISRIEDELLDDGRTKITIYFADDTIDPKVFYIPQGIAGAGIKDVNYSINEKDHSTQIQISFTSDEIEPVSFNIPHGVSVYNIISGYDDEKKAPYLIVQYNDGSTSEKFYLPKGDKGNGIKSYDYKLNDDKSITLEFEFDDNTKITIPIPAPKDGEDGVGITSITPREEGRLFYLDIEYTSGDIVPISFERPHQWYQGGDNPNKILNDDGTSIGLDGDYFFDTDHVTIYVKEQGTWNVVISFSDIGDNYTVKFNLNDNGDAKMPTGSLSSYTVVKGTYFSDKLNGKNDIPVPTRSGYTFKGWCTKSTYNPSTMSLFTDLTPIFSDLELFAIWELDQ